MSHGREVILEFRQIGNAVKVTAVDPETLVEVSIMGSAASGEETLRRAALRKLDYVLRKRQGGGYGAGGRPPFLLRGPCECANQRPPVITRIELKTLQNNGGWATDGCGGETPHPGSITAPSFTQLGHKPRTMRRA